MIESIFRKLPLLRVYYKGFMNRAFQLLDRGGGVKVMEEEWDNLIVLDACRYDFFQKVNWIDGKLKKKISSGSHTEEWMRKNFRGNYPDTIYVSGNPQISEIKCQERFGKIPFHKIESVWDYGWDEEEGTSPPERVSKAALKIRNEYPEKRLIIHYMQPHWPFPTWSEVSPADLEPDIEPNTVDRDFLWRITSLLSKKFSGLKLALEKRSKKGGNIWDYMREGLVSVSEAKSAYEDNLKIVLETVEKLLKSLDGFIVITSDHGNLFGEYWMYGHPPRLHFKELVEVPWLEIKEDSRIKRSIEKEKKRIKKRIRDLRTEELI